jgi:hypothetical protein
MKSISRMSDFKMLSVGKTNFVALNSVMEILMQILVTHSHPTIKPQSKVAWKHTKYLTSYAYTNNKWQQS